MVSVNFKLFDLGRIEVCIERPEPLGTVLQRCVATADIELGAIIAIRGGVVIQGSQLVEDGDSIDIFPAISGG